MSFSRPADLPFDRLRAHQPPSVWVYGAADMVGHMKTTVEINDALLTEVRRLAERRGETMRSLLEEALRRLIAAYESGETTPPPFELTVVDGDGLVEGVTPASWLEIANDWGSVGAASPR
jgi:Bacterial antitoxin of type II TA system, VapB